jgi:hypothetical protein
MRNLKRNSVVLAVVFCVFSSNFVYAWNDKVTHPAVTVEAIEKIKDKKFVPYLQNNLGFKKDIGEKLPYKNEQMTILDILKEGSREEDAWPDKSDPETARSMNHFHSPINDMGLSQGEKCIIPFIGCFQLEGESALAWARGDISENEYSWGMAWEYYAEALFTNESSTRDAKLAKTFRSLGQIMHLIQDMAVPAHTRNGVV